MEITLIRNATLKLKYAGSTLLIDPYFAAKHSQPSFGGKSKNPITDLPISISEIMAGVDAVLISHLHPDHFDEVAKQTLPKDTKIFCQPADFESIKAMGFEDLTSIDDDIRFNDMEITRTEGQHGEGHILPVMGSVSGFVFKSSMEKTIYWMGDTIWYEKVKKNIDLYNPEIIVSHTGGNEFIKEYDVFQIGLKANSGAVIFDKEQLLELCNYTNGSQIIATHMDALDHETVSRKSLRAFAKEKRIETGKLFIPEDGETLKL